MSKTLIQTIRDIVAKTRKAGYIVSQAKAKNAVAQAYGFHCYNAAFYECDGRTPNTQFIEATYFRCIGYPDGGFK